MFDFFFYGTLVDADVRRLVLRREVPDEMVVPAVLSAFKRYAVRGRPYPAAVPVAGASIDGVVMPQVSLRDAAMLTCFEGSDYEARLCQVTPSSDPGTSRSAWVFVASERVPHSEAAWSIDDWRAQHKPAFIEIATSWLGRINESDIGTAEQVWRDRLAAGDAG